MIQKTAFLHMPKVFSPMALKTGEEYYRQGYVLHILFSEGLVKARVKDSSNRIYNVHFDLKIWPQKPTLCSCSLRINCEHAAACLFSLQNRNSENAAEPSNATPGWARDDEVFNAEDLIWYSDVQENNHDFFSYQLGILIDDKPVNIVPLVLDLMTRWDYKTLVSLSDSLSLKLPLKPGKVLKIEFGRIKPLLLVLMQYGLHSKLNKAKLKLKPYQLLLMLEAEKAIAATAARWQGTRDVRQTLRLLSNTNALPQVKIPTGLCASLRDYQHEGLSWLQYLREHQFGGVLADDMGLGKTVQTLALFQYEKEAGRLNKACLIVVPASLVGNWMEEAKRFTPDLKVLMFHGLERHQVDFDEYDLIISTYGLLQRDKSRFLNYLFYYVILDEAQFIKNTRTKTTQIVHQLRAENRLCLTGTPLQNHLGELWSLFHFLMPGFLGDARQFRQLFKTPIEKHGDVEQKEMLSKRIQPFLLRRTKNEVAKELPPKTIIPLTIELHGAQRDLYEAIRMSMEKKVREAIARQGLAKSHIVLLDALLRLRQICCDPKLLSFPQAEMAYGASAKLDALMELLDNLMEEGRRVLVFSQFTSMLKIIEAQLNSRKYDYLKLTGQTQNRHALVRAFQKGNIPIFLISLKAGGVGLNLTKADTVIHYDPWWNPAAEEQATDRSHRIGQKKPVFVYKLIALGTVEETIVKMQENKRQLVENILTTTDSKNLALTEDDITRFFAPIAE